MTETALMTPVAMGAGMIASFAAIGMLLGAAGRARVAGGDLEVVCTDPRLLDRFAVTRLDRAVVVRDRVPH